MHRIGDEYYWEYYDAQVSDELFQRLLSRSRGFLSDDPKNFLPGDLFLVFWKSSADLSFPPEAMNAKKYLCALLTPANISTGFTDKMNFTNPEYEANSNCFTLHRGYMNVSWFARRVI